MGQVYRARDPRLERDIALKILQTDDASHRKRFAREARAVAALNHPNIVTIHSVEEFEGQPFLPLDVVGVPFAAAPPAAHARGIVHRDLKPPNVMISTDGRVKMLDFGLAKNIEAKSLASAEETREGQIIGTLAYMSPEQLMADTVDARSDIFSLGVLIYEMATGKRPFDGPNPAVILVSLLNTPVPAIGGASADLDRIISRATA